MTVPAPQAHLSRGSVCPSSLVLVLAPLSATLSCSSPIHCDTVQSVKLGVFHRY